MPGPKTNTAAEQAANAITLSKWKAIAERLQLGKREPTTAEARFAATFIDHVRIETMIGWLEQLRMTFECDADSAKLAKFIENLKGG
jgi:phosphoribosylformylglycinamidine (FGAM) synthase-like enzyme